ncbi:hypothetical protein RZS08_05315, partial [Arthrospira platensis SPKY1]|nr:hypothetical protein [Arthrospira platensis SPKY1]
MEPAGHDLGGHAPDGNTDLQLSEAVVAPCDHDAARQQGQAVLAAGLDHQRLMHGWRHRGLPFEVAP